ncbi:hypothetical protein CRENBAI_011145 [Crenichthys baileyi]|uniref:Uncharacterized protein n=1 Tax=Crenichthys baileyi TaxID=28760 RepID=A0AAV9S0W0_9TELE
MPRVTSMSWLQDPVRIPSRTLISSFQEPLKNQTPVGSRSFLLPGLRQANPAHPPPNLKAHQVLFSVWTVKLTLSSLVLSPTLTSATTTYLRPHPQLPREQWAATVRCPGSIQGVKGLAQGPND